MHTTQLERDIETLRDVDMSPAQRQALERVQKTANAALELLEACSTFSEWLAREEAGFPAASRYDTPEGEELWRTWFYENLRLCDLAQTQSRAAIAKAGV